MEINLSQAVEFFVDELDKDKSEGGYYYAWQSNIAMAILDQLVEEGLLMPHGRLYKLFHESINNGSKRFLNQLISSVQKTRASEKQILG